MNEQTFLENFKEAIETDQVLTLATNFRDLDEWDSLAALSVIAMLDEEYDAVIEGNTFKEMNTLEEVFNFVKSKV